MFNQWISVECFEWHYSRLCYILLSHRKIRSLHLFEPIHSKAAASQEQSAAPVDPLQILVMITDWSISL